MKKSLFSAILLFLTAFFAQAQNITVHGLVVSAADNEPLIGATVMCVNPSGTNIGTATDIDGNFQLTVPEGATLKISYVGYLPQTVAESQCPFRKTQVFLTRWWLSAIRQ